MTDAAILALGLVAGAAAVALGWWLLARQGRRSAWTPVETALQHVRELAQAGSQMEAIRLYRKLTGRSLADATDVVEALSTPPRDATQDGTEVPPPNATVEKLVRQRRIPEAIKAYQDQTGADVSQAREVVERLLNGVN